MSNSNNLNIKNLLITKSVENYDPVILLRNFIVQENQNVAILGSNLKGKKILYEYLSDKLYKRNIEERRVVDKFEYEAYFKNNAKKLKHDSRNDQQYIVIEDIKDNVDENKLKLYSDEELSEFSISDLDTKLFGTNKESFILFTVSITLALRYAKVIYIMDKEGRLIDVAANNFSYEVMLKDIYEHKTKHINNFQLRALGAYQVIDKLIDENVKRLPFDDKNFFDLMYLTSIKNSILSAISQVMARNTSHNIGAHVMNKLIGDLNEINLFKFDEDKIYYKSDTKKSITQLSENIINDKKKIKELNEEEKKNIIILDQISKFNNYVKCRMDYLADVSFGTPLMQTNKYAYEDLFLKFDEVRLLLEHISGLSEFPFRIEFTRNGKLFKNNTREKGEDDLLVAIPNDILGTQAFYNIIENVIRNTAKHGKKPENDRECVFTVNFIDEIDNTDYKNAKNKVEIENILNEFIAVEIFDNYPVYGDGRPLKEDEIEEFKRTKTDIPPMFDSQIDILVFNQNKKLNLNILENSKLRPYSLGLVEMEASAAYLRKRPVEYINHSSYKIHYNDSWSRDTENNCGDQTIRGTNCRHFLKAFKKTVSINGKKENYLGYRFFLHRPAVVLVVTKELPENIDLLKRQGIWVVTQSQFEKHIKLDDKSYPHEFIVISVDIVFDPIDDDVNGIITKVPFLEYYKTSLPVRVISIKMEKLKELFDCDLNKWEEYCWMTWNECFLKLDYRQSPYLPMKNGQFSSFYSHEYPPNDSVNFYLDVLSSIGLNKLPEFNGDIGLYPSKILGKSDVIKFKVGESIYSRVLVIDERIQENSLKNFSERPISLLYNKSGILIPKYNLSANKIRFIEIYNDINKYLLCGINSNNNTEGVEKLNKKYDFILIHYSILERIFNSNKSKIETFLIKLGRLYNVVITSGRGEPDGLPKEVRFINLSSVIHALVESRSKYFANYILHQSRKSSKLKIK